MISFWATDKIKLARRAAKQTKTAINVGHFREADEGLEYAIKLLQEAQKLLRGEPTE